MNFEKRPRGTFFALALIVAGALLFLDNLGILPVENIGGYWPLALVVYGLGIVYYRRSYAALVWSGTLIAGGVLLTLGNLGLLRVSLNTLWPLLLIAVGVLMLVERPWWVARRRDRKAQWNDRKAQWNAWQERHLADKWPGAANVTANKINEVAVFFSLKRRVETPDFEGGELVAVFGSVEVDFYNSTIQTPDRRALLDASAVFGAVEISVPRHWRVVKEGTGVFGSYEDKTLPARAEPGVETVTLVVRGGAVFGSVTIRN